MEWIEFLQRERLCKSEETKRDGITKQNKSK